MTSDSSQQMKHVQPGHQVVEAPEKTGARSETLGEIARVFEGLDYQKEHTEGRGGAEITLHTG